MLNGVEIQPTSSLRYLWIELDENLTGCAQVDRCRKKAAALVATLRSIAGMTWGVNTLNLRRMWTAVLLPQIAFACSAWRDERRRGDGAKSHGIDPVPSSLQDSRRDPHDLTLCPRDLSVCAASLDHDATPF